MWNDYISQYCGVCDEFWSDEYSYCPDCGNELIIDYDKQEQTEEYYNDAWRQHSKK